MKAKIKDNLLTLYPVNEQELGQIKEYVDNLVDDAAKLSIPVSDFIIDDSQVEYLKHFQMCEVDTEMPGYSPRCQECSEGQKNKCITDDFKENN